MHVVAFASLHTHVFCTCNFLHDGLPTHIHVCIAPHIFYARCCRSEDNLVAGVIAQLIAYLNESHRSCSAANALLTEHCRDWDKHVKDTGNELAYVE